MPRSWITRSKTRTTRSCKSTCHSCFEPGAAAASKRAHGENAGARPAVRPGQEARRESLDRLRPVVVAFVLEMGAQAFVVSPRHLLRLRLGNRRAGEPAGGE